MYLFSLHHRYIEVMDINNPSAVVDNANISEHYIALQDALLANPDQR